jgi:hypothetical protein
VPLKTEYTAAASGKPYLQQQTPSQLDVSQHRSATDIESHLVTDSSLEAIAPDLVHEFEHHLKYQSA